MTERGAFLADRYGPDWGSTDAGELAVHEAVMILLKTERKAVSTVFLEIRRAI